MQTNEPQPTVLREEIVLDRIMTAIKAGDRKAALFVLKSALDDAQSKGWVKDGQHTSRVVIGLVDP